MDYRRWLAAILLLAMLVAPGAQAKVEILYTIEIDLANQVVTVYHNRKDRGEEDIVRQMICSSGTGSKTPTGTFTMPKPRYSKERTEWYYFGEFDVYAKYASRIVGGILFHSVLYNSKHSGPTWGSVNALGSKASHGCIRLRVEDAKWIADNCPPGTKVRIFKDGERDEELRGLLLAQSFSADDMAYADFRRGEISLVRGARFSKVTQLQQQLINLGYLDDEADGIFGERTERAVRAWQETRGLETTGVVSPAQLNEILSDTSPAPAAASTPVPAETPEPAQTPEPDATSTPEPTPSPTPPIENIPGVVARAKVRDNLRLRAAANLDCNALVAIYNAEPMQVLCEGPVWSKVRYQNFVGWVSSKYIEIVRDADAA